MQYRPKTLSQQHSETAKTMELGMQVEQTFGGVHDKPKWKRGEATALWLPGTFRQDGISNLTQSFAQPGGGLLPTHET
jgi:hypothetical protein